MRSALLLACNSRDLSLSQSLNLDSLLLLSAEAAGKAKEFKPEYAQESYYATLGLYLISLPGAWSLIKRSVEYKPVNKVYETKGPSAGKEVRVNIMPTHVCAEISSSYSSPFLRLLPSFASPSYCAGSSNSSGDHGLLSRHELRARAVTGHHHLPRDDGVRGR